MIEVDPVLFGHAVRDVYGECVQCEVLTAQRLDDVLQDGPTQDWLADDHARGEVLDALDL